ncbi:hypothetical protein [Clostridium algidicarnis]|uniref:hypothetical protein n=1 Tax=Clostridium algidicarnis TaxID=37659 RepID=UPI0004954100|nr:hypothetical protein [Clostridium algidicarnis]
MELTFKHNVLIIDDRYEEAVPLIQALSIKGVYTIYWDGKVENKPQNPLNGIRFVFLDMRFSAVTDQRSINTFLFTLLKSAINIENGPYVLFIWSKHDNEYLEGFKKELLEQAGIAKPYLIINMEKSNFIQTVYEKNEVYEEIASTLDTKELPQIKKEILEVLNNFNINDRNEMVVIKENGSENLIIKLEEKIKEISSLNILFMWEKIVNLAAINLVNTVSDFSEFNEDWDNNIKTLIQNLAVANAGKSLGQSAQEYIINALSALNQMLPDELVNQLVREKIDEETFDFIKNHCITKTINGIAYSITKANKKYLIKKGSTDYKNFKTIDELEKDSEKKLLIELYSEYVKLLGKSNFKLLCESATLDEIKKPGSIYNAKDDVLLRDLCNSIFKKTEIKEITNISLIKLDISSSCDYSQNKLKRVRIIPGIIFGEEYFSYIDNTEDIYCTPEVEIKGKLSKIGFNFNFITNTCKSELTESDRIFSFRELLLLEIKQKLAAYILRVGIMNM